MEYRIVLAESGLSVARKSVLVGAVISQ